MRKGAPLLFLALACCASAAADKTTMKATFGGNDAGTNVFESTEPGVLRSTTDFTIAGGKIESSLTLKSEKGRVLSFELTQKAGPNDMRVVFDGSKLTVSAAGKTSTTDLKGKPAAALANFHPQTLQTLLAAYDRLKSGKQTIQTLLVDSGTILNAEVSARGSISFNQAGHVVFLHEFEVTLAGISLSVLEDGKGTVIGMNVPMQAFQVVVVGFEGVFVDPTAKYKELSQPTMRSRVLKAVRIRMRDGVETVADVALPDAKGRFPAILIRTPYGRAPQFAGAKADWWAKRGYAFVVQDCRGRHDSGGEWDPFMHERKDGYDTVQWIAKQPWSDGNVGMIGGSYSGEVQWAAAVEVPPALKCIVPQVPPPDAMFNLPYDYGTFPLYTSLWWANLVKAKETNLGLAGKPFPHSEKLTTVPLSGVAEAVLGQKIPFFDKWLQRTTAKQWAGWNYEADLVKVKIPALMISGWWDGDGIGTKRNWRIMAQLGRTNEWLIDGPWPHAFNSTTSFAGIDYGPTAVLELDSVYLRWFDTWLKHRKVGLEKTPKVRVFLTGANEWRTLQGWPDRRSKQTRLFLSVQKPKEGAKALGELVAQPPTSQAPSGYSFDPSKGSVPAGVGAPKAESATTVVPFGDGGVENLTFKTAPLTAAVDMGGPIAIDLWFSSSVRDADFFAVVVDIDEKGVARMVGMPGKIRASYLSGWDNPKPIVPGKIYRATLDHWDTAHRFFKGHRIGLAISSGMFPMYARNPGTGDPIATATRMVAAKETIYHDAKHPSCLCFMVIPAK